MLMETEIWKDIPWYEWLYRICSIGEQIESYGTRNKWRMLKISYTSGYYHISLYKKWICKQYLVHRLKAITFIPNPFGKQQVNHIDGNKLNNDLLNLEWCTASENTKHAIKTWLIWHHPTRGKFWKESKSAKPVLQYSKSWEFIKEWWSVVDARRELNIYSIYQVCQWIGKTAWWYKWKYKY